MNIHASAEDYLETILVLKQRMGDVRSIDIVNELNYSKPSVSIAMKKLRENGYIEVDGGASLPALIARPAFWDEGKDTLVYVELRDTDGNLLSENFYQYWKDSELEYEKPNLTVEKLDEYSFAITTDTYTKNIFIEAHDNEAVLSDNYFHLLKGQRKVVTSTKELDFEKMEIMTLNEVEK